MLEQLIEERSGDKASLSLERLVAGQGKRRGRPPAWLKASKRVRRTARHRVPAGAFLHLCRTPKVVVVQFTKSLCRIFWWAYQRLLVNNNQDKLSPLVVPADWEVLLKEAMVCHI